MPSDFSAPDSLPPSGGGGQPTNGRTQGLPLPESSFNRCGFLHTVRWMKGVFFFCTSGVAFLSFAVSQSRFAFFPPPPPIISIPLAAFHTKQRQLATVRMLTSNLALPMDVSGAPSPCPLLCPQDRLVPFEHGEDLVRTTAFLKVGATQTPAERRTPPPPRELLTSLPGKLAERGGGGGRGGGIAMEVQANRGYRPPALAKGPV